MSSKYSRTNKEYKKGYMFEQVYVPKNPNANNLANQEPKSAKKMNSELTQAEKQVENGSRDKKCRQNKTKDTQNESGYTSKKDTRNSSKKNEVPKNRDVKGPRSRHVTNSQYIQKPKKELTKVEYVEKPYTPSSKKLKLLSEDPKLFPKEAQVTIKEILTQKTKDVSSEGSTDSKATDTTDKSHELNNTKAESNNLHEKSAIQEEDKSQKERNSLELFTNYLPPKNEVRDTLEKLDFEAIEDKVEKIENEEEDDEIDHNQIFALRILSRGFSRPAIEVETKPTPGYNIFRNAATQNFRSPMTSIKTPLSIVPEQMEANYIYTQSAYLPSYSYEDSACNCNVTQNANRADELSIPNYYIPFPQSAVGLEYDTESLFEDTTTNVSAAGEVNQSDRMSPISSKNTPASKRLMAFTQQEETSISDPEYPPGKLQVGGIVFNVHPRRLNSNSQEPNPMIQSKINNGFFSRNNANENMFFKLGGQQPLRRNNDAMVTLGKLQEATRITPLNQLQDFAWKAVFNEEGLECSSAGLRVMAK